MKIFTFILVVVSIAVCSTRSITDYANLAGKYIIVSKSIFISSGDTLIVPQGREVLFTNLSGIIVYSGGAISAIGTKDQPIYFTSLLDTSGAASAYDWNGIEIKKGAIARFSYCFIAFSASGITAEDSTGIQLESCIFSVNGQWNFSLSGITTQIPDLQPYSYFPKPQQQQIASTPVIKKPHIRPREFVLGGVGAALVIVGAAMVFKANDYHTEYTSYVPGTAAFDAVEPSERQRHFEELRDKYNASSAIGGICLGLAAIDGVFLAITVRF